MTMRLFQVWQAIAAMTSAIAFGVCLIHWRFGKGIDNAFHRYALIASSLLFAETACNVARLFYIVPYSHAFSIQEIVIGILGRAFFGIGMAIWGGYLLGLWNGVRQ